MRFPDLGRARGLLLLEAASFKPLAVFRIGIALVLLVQVQVLWRFREILLAQEGPIPWVVTDRILDPLLPRVSTFAAVLGPLGIGPEQVTAVFLALHAVAALLLLVGWRTRIAALVAWGTYLPLRYTAHLFFYGIGSMLLIGLFYCVILPVGRAWSLDALRRAREAAGDALDASLAVAVLRIHVCIIYLAAGLSKAVGEQWWSGEAIWRSLSLPRFQQYDLQAAAAFPLLLQAAALGAVAVQLAYPVLVWTRLRAAIVLVTELMHLAIAVFLGLWLFSAVMIVFNLAAFGESLWNALRRWSGATARA